MGNVQLIKLSLLSYPPTTHLGSHGRLFHGHDPLLVGGVELEPDVLAHGERLKGWGGGLL